MVQDAKFGMFIHWGIYSTLGDAEWVIQNQNIPVTRYELLPNFCYSFDFVSFIGSLNNIVPKEIPNTQ